MKLEGLPLRSQPTKEKGVRSNETKSALATFCRKVRQAKNLEQEERHDSEARQLASDSREDCPDRGSKCDEIEATWSLASEKEVETLVFVGKDEALGNDSMDPLVEPSETSQVVPPENSGCLVVSQNDTIGQHPCEITMPLKSWYHTMIQLSSIAAYESVLGNVVSESENFLGSLLNDGTQVSQRALQKIATEEVVDHVAKVSVSGATTDPKRRRERSSRRRGHRKKGTTRWLWTMFDPTRGNKDSVRSILKQRRKRTFITTKSKADHNGSNDELQGRQRRAQESCDKAKHSPARGAGAEYRRANSRGLRESTVDRVQGSCSSTPHSTAIPSVDASLCTGNSSNPLSRIKKSLPVRFWRHKEDDTLWHI